LIPADDAPDIVANTFLAKLSDETLKKIRYGFFEHRERELSVSIFYGIINPVYQSSQRLMATLRGR